MTLPTIIISSRASLKSVPPSIREAARGLGASPLQVVFHHVLPLAMPGILTGTIIGLAQALGETAPLLMIGMVAFIVDVPQGVTDAATVLPVQVFLWADSPERAFVEKTSAAIMVLLAFLIAMNAVAGVPQEALRAALVAPDAGPNRTPDPRPPGPAPRRAPSMSIVADDILPRSRHLDTPLKDDATDAFERLTETVGDVTVDDPKMRTEGVDVFYGDKQAIHDVSLDIGNNEVIAMIGPSGCGKSTFLRCLNRMNDTIPSCRVTGSMSLDGEDLYGRDLDPVLLRARVGMVFQKPNPFAKSIYDNVAYGPRIHGLAGNRAELDDIVVDSLKKAGLHDEVKDRLDAPGTSLSGGQQQRLCIARTIAVSPEVILMDEPCSALDPIATARIEELIDELRQNYAIAIVTHSMQQAARVSQRTAYFHLGKLVEVGDTNQVFTNPTHELTENYITGRFG